MSKKARLAVAEINVPAVLARTKGIDREHLASMKTALSNGAKFPPITVDPNGNILVEGHHRLTLYTEEFGADYVTDVILMPFESEADRIAHSYAVNLTHGLRPSRQDTEAMVRLLGVQFSWPVSKICTHFRIDEVDVVRALRNTVAVKVENRANVKPMRLKTSVRRTQTTRTSKAVVVDSAADSVDTVEDPVVINLTEIEDAIVRRSLGSHGSLIIRQVADSGRLPEKFWPDPTELLMEHLDDARAFLDRYAAWVAERDAEAA